MLVDIVARSSTVALCHTPGMDSFPVPATELLRTAPDAILVVDTEGRIRWCNDATADLFGYGAGELGDEPVEMLVPTASRTVHAGLRAGYEEQPTARPMGGGRRLHGLRADGTTFVLQIALSPLTIDGEHYTAAVARDMTEWVEGERRVERAEWATRLAEDRERIARDLHDTVIQELFAAGMSLQAVVGGAGSERVAQRLSDTIDTIDTIIREIRETIFWLQRPAADTVREESVRNVVSALVDSLGFEPELVIRGDLASVSDDVASSLEVVVREGLSNVARHAGASSARVEITIDSHAEVVISDDGVGLPEPLPRTSGLGNLHVRARRLGGEMDVINGSEGGSRLRWRATAEAVATGLGH